MTADVRISVGLPAHPKTKKLIRKLGYEGAWRLVCLFIWVAQNKPDGNLTGMQEDDIELAVDWSGEEGAFVAALVSVGYLDGSNEDGFFIHDWREHNPWAADADVRSEKAKWNALCKHHGRDEAARRMPEYASRHAKSTAAAGKKPADEVSAADESCAASLHAAEEVSATSMHAAETSTAPSPSPSPSPSLKEANASVASGDLPACNVQAIIDLYHEALPELPAVRILSDQRRKAARSFWRWVLTSKKSDGSHRAQTADQALTWIRAYFARANDNDFLMGRHGISGAHANWRADFDFLLTERGKKHVIEKTEAAA